MMMAYLKWLWTFPAKGPLAAFIVLAALLVLIMLLNKAIA